MYRCKCGKEFEKSQSYVAHCGHCKINLGREPVDRFGDSRAWSKGLTKETDSRILAVSERLRGKTPFKGHHHTEETRANMAEIARYNAKNRINGWKSGSSKEPNKYERFTENFLISRGISYEREVTIPQSVLGKKGSYYQLDFLIGGMIDLEIDGSAHDKDHDDLRDSYVNKKYRVYRIRHHDSLEELEIELNRFVSTL